MQDLIGCEATLLKLKRSLEIRGDSTKHVDPESKYIPKMTGYLRALQNEYADNYIEVAERQRYDDAVNRRQLKKFAEEDVVGNPDQFDGSYCTWDWLSAEKNCSVLHDLINCGTRYNVEFLQPLNCVATQLAGTTHSSRPFDRQLDNQVDKIAKDIASELRIEAASKASVQRVARSDG